MTLRQWRVFNVGPYCAQHVLAAVFGTNLEQRRAETAREASHDNRTRQTEIQAEDPKSKIKRDIRSEISRIRVTQDWKIPKSRFGRIIIGRVVAGGSDQSTTPLRIKVVGETSRKRRRSA